MVLARWSVSAKPRGLNRVLSPGEQMARVSSLAVSAPSPRFQEQLQAGRTLSSAGRRPKPQCWEGVWMDVCGGGEIGIYVSGKADGCGGMTPPWPMAAWCHLQMTPMMPRTSRGTSGERVTECVKCKSGLQSVCRLQVE